jgi:hypothetical protein
VIRRLAARALALAALAAATPATATEPACSPEAQRSSPGAGRTTWATGGAFDFGMPREELPLALAQLDGYLELLKAAIGPAVGFDEDAHQVVGAEPVVKKGPQPQEASIQVSEKACVDGKARAVFRAKVTVEVNRLWNLLGEQQLLDGKRVYLSGYPLGEIQGAPLYSMPPSQDEQAYRWVVALPRDGQLPFRALTRGEVLARLKPHLAARRAASLREVEAGARIRPAAEQEKEKQAEVAEIKMENAGDQAAAARRVARYLADFQSDEQKLEKARRAVTVEVDAALARVEALELKHGKQGLQAPATVGPGGFVAILRDAAWDFVPPVTERGHRCTVDCRHGQLVMVPNDDYWSKGRPRHQPQSALVVYDWVGPRQAKGLQPFADALRDRFFQRLDLKALQATLVK